MLWNISCLFIESCRPCLHPLNPVYKIVPAMMRSIFRFAEMMVVLILALAMLDVLSKMLRYVFHGFFLFTMVTRPYITDVHEQSVHFHYDYIAGVHLLYVYFHFGKFSYITDVHELYVYPYWSGYSRSMRSRMFNKTIPLLCVHLHWETLYCFQDYTHVSGQDKVNTRKLYFIKNI